MNNLIYPVIFTETDDKNSTVLVYIPDFDGCTEAYGLQDAFVMAKDFICNALYDKDNPPMPSKHCDICIEETPFYNENKSYLAFIEVNLKEFMAMQKSKTVRRNITLPEWLDDMATRKKLNVSAITQQALKNALQIN